MGCAWLIGLAVLGDPGPAGDPWTTAASTPLVGGSVALAALESLGAALAARDAVWALSRS